LGTRRGRRERGHSHLDVSGLAEAQRGPCSGGGVSGPGWPAYVPGRAVHTRSRSLTSLAVRAGQPHFATGNPGVGDAPYRRARGRDPGVACFAFIRRPDVDYVLPYRRAWSPRWLAGWGIAAEFPECSSPACRVPFVSAPHPRDNPRHDSGDFFFPSPSGLVLAAWLIFQGIQPDAVRRHCHRPAPARIAPRNPLRSPAVPAAFGRIPRGPSGARQALEPPSRPQSRPPAQHCAVDTQLGDVAFWPRSHSSSRPGSLGRACRRRGARLAFPAPNMEFRGLVRPLGPRACFLSAPRRTARDAAVLRLGGSVPASCLASLYLPSWSTFGPGCLLVAALI